MELTRKQVIEELQKMLDYCSIRQDSTPERKQALVYAISSLKTDEAYQLDYEGIQNIVVTDGMTNGDVIKMMFPNAEYKDMHNISITKRNSKYMGLQFTGMADREWWDSPYKGE